MCCLRFVAVLALVLMLVPTASADPGDQPEKQGDWGLAQLQAEIDALRAEIMKLASDAKRDPRDLLLEQYKAFTADDFKNKKREPRVKDMLDWIFDSEDSNFNLKLASVEALGEAVWKDPDLDSTRKGSRQSPRSKLSQREIVPFLDDKDKKTRGLAQALLQKFWGEPRDPAVRDYKLEERHKKTWDAAQRAWNKFLRGR